MRYAAEGAPGDGGSPGIGTCVARLSPDATFLPPLPGAMSLRISQAALVTPEKSMWLLENTPTTVHPLGGTTKSSYTRENSPSLKNQLGWLGSPGCQSPLYQPVTTAAGCGPADAS